MTALIPRNDIEKLAEKLHQLYCGQNHEEYCSWLYERDWEDDAHKRWKLEAERILIFIRLNRIKL